MHIEQSIKPISPIILKNDTENLNWKFNRQKETFRDIFQRSLNHKSGSRPPKIELTGMLIPLLRPISFNQCN
jgi:hypothetical protein